MIKNTLIKSASRITLLTAAAGMAFAPIAAQADTRAGDNAPVYATQGTAQPGADRDDDGEGIVGIPTLFAALFAAAVAAGTIVVIDDAGDEDDLDQSPGT